MGAFNTINVNNYPSNMDNAMLLLKDTRIRQFNASINGKQYPIKQVIRVVLRIPLMAFTSMDAYRLLNKLGFEIGTREE